MTKCQTLSLQHSTVVSSLWPCFIIEARYFYVFMGSVILRSLEMRMVLLMMVVVCLNGCFMLEQPFSSYFEFYPRFRDFIAMLQKHGGRHAVPYPN